MMKRILAMLLLILLPLTAANATILPPAGVDEDFAAWTGIECTPAVILCEELSIYDARGDQGGKKVGSLSYTGRDVAVIESWDGWAKIYYADATKTGWVRSEYLLFDPAWYRCDVDRQVYAYPDSMSPRVAYLEAGTLLPILTQTEADGSSWVCVSLRGAAGWIRLTAQDTVEATWFRPEMLCEIDGAMLTWRGESIYTNEPEQMIVLSGLLTSTNDLGGEMAGCPFDATLEVYLKNGQTVTLAVATDSCCVFRVDGRDYQYARFLVDGDDSPDNSVLLQIFGLEAWEDLLLPANG